MNSADLWKSILTFAFGSGILIAVLGFIARSVFLHFLSQDLETHRAGLAADNASALEQFKAQLRTAAFEHEIRFSRLYEKKLEVLGELYRRMARAEAAFDDYTRPLQPGGEEQHRERGKLAAKVGNEFLEYLNEHDVYLDGSLARQFRDIWETFHRAWAEFIPEPRGVDWLKAYEAYKQEAPVLRGAIRDQVQRILEGRSQ